MNRVAGLSEKLGVPYRALSLKGVIGPSQALTSGAVQ